MIKEKDNRHTSFVYLQFDFEAVEFTSRKCNNPIMIMDQRCEDIMLLIFIFQITQITAWD